MAMKRMSVVQFAVMLIVLFLAGLATLSVSSACSLATVSPIVVGPNFRVKVSGYDGPVKALQVQLTGPGSTVQRAITDGNGIAYFRNAAPGKKYVSADHGGGYVDLEVKENGPADPVIPMRWPSTEPIHVRSLAGTMRAPNAVAGRLEQPVLSLELIDGVSGRILTSLKTTGRGEFDFGQLLPSASTSFTLCHIPLFSIRLRV